MWPEAHFDASNIRIGHLHPLPAPRDAPKVLVPPFLMLPGRGNVTCQGHPASKWQSGDPPLEPPTSKAQGHHMGRVCVCAHVLCVRVCPPNSEAPLVSLCLELNDSMSRQSGHRQRQWQQLCVWQAHLVSFQGHKSLFHGRRWSAREQCGSQEQHPRQPADKAAAGPHPGSLEPSLHGHPGCS